MKLKITITLVLIIIVGFTGWRIYKVVHKNSSNNKAAEKTQKKEPNINGSMVNSDQANLRPLAIVVENHTDSRPQSGLGDAEIVYETLAEGGITRFIAIFQANDPKEIGPVRSARPYFNFIANMWHAPIIHAGGSKQALTELSSGVYKNLFDVNEFYFGDYFYRDTERLAPHNLYTTIEDQRKILHKKNQTDWNKINVWDTQNTPADQLVTQITKISIPFSTPSYEVNYDYDLTSNSYKRLTGGIITIDKNNDSQISPKNILIMLTDITLNQEDDLGTQSIRLNGNGSCFLFSRGKFQQCKWEYREGRHYYTDQDGNSLKLEAGQTWIEIFPRDRQNEIKWS